MTIEGAIVELQSWIDSEAIPAWAKPSLKKIKETVEAEREEHLWIPVTDRLPEESGWYLVSLLGCSEPIKTGYFGFFMKNGCFDKTTTLGFKVTAWMPLPKPYEVATKLQDSCKERGEEE